MVQPDTYTLRLLRAQSHQLAHEISLVPFDAVHWQPAAGEWSVQECLTHIRDCERHIFLPRIRRTITEDGPPLPLADDSMCRYDPDEPIQQILAEFVADRAAETALLEQADWARIGLHETRGPITVAWQAQYVVNHTWEHLSQAMRARLNYLVRK